MPTIKQLSRIFSDDNSLNRLQDQLAAALNPILRNVQGDLSGPLESPLVVALQGTAVSKVAPTTGQFLAYNGVQWIPTAGPSTSGVTAVTATAPVVSSGGTTPNISMPQSSASSDGWLSSVDWAAFNSKVGTVTASAPLASSGGLSPNISLTGVVSAAHGGTGLSSPGTAGNVLTSTGTGWTSSAVTAVPSGPAGGVLGYPGSTYPNPNGLAANVFGAPSVAYIPIKAAVDQFGAYKETWFKLDDNSDQYGNSIALRAADSTTGFFGISIRGGNAGVIGGRGAPNYSGGEGGAAYLLGGQATGPWTGGPVNINGGPGGSSAGQGGPVNIYGGTAGSGGVGGVVNVGTYSTSAINIGAAYPVPALAWQGQPINVTAPLPATNQALTWNGSQWHPAYPSALPKFGNIAVVDAVNGNDLTGGINGAPFLTVEVGLAAITAAGSPATLWIMPGTYTLASATTGLTMPTGCTMRGHNVQTTKIVMNASNPGGTVTMLTMGESSRVEDLTFNLNCTDATTNLVGVNTPGTSSTTSKIRTSVVTVDNSTLAYTTSTDVYGIYDNGTGTLGAASFSFNFTRGVTVNVFSNGGGKKRAVYVDTANDITFRDTNFYVRAPTSASSTGSYVGVETTDSNASVQFRTSSISGPSTAGSYTGSDILQTSPGTGFINTGIQIGPGCDLVNKTAGGKPFTTYVTPTTLIYGLFGNVANGTHYMWPGTLVTNLDNSEVFYRVQQKCIIQGMSFNVRTAPGVGKTLTVTINKSSTGVAGSGVATTMTKSISGATTNGTQYTTSVDLAIGEYISVRVDGTSGIGAQDLVVELDLF